MIYESPKTENMIGFVRTKHKDIYID